jgi:glycosyltransferase involved in cell wall biosynthesis
MPKSILIFEAYPFFSGSQRITLNVCKILKKNDFHVVLLLADDRFGTLKKIFTPCVDEIIYVKANDCLLQYGNEDSWFTKKKFLKSVFLGLLPFYSNCLKILFSKKIDYLYCCDPRGASMMLVPAMLFKGTSILHFHGKNRLPKLFSKLILKSFDKVLCVSNDVYDSLPKKRNKHVLLNGIDFSLYDNIDTELVENEIAVKIVKKSKDLIRFLFVGAIRPNKGLHHIIYALNNVIRTFKDSSTKPILFISGEARTQSEINYKSQLIDFCVENGISDYVYWLGWNNNVLGWMKSCDYLVFSSINREKNRFEGFGNVVESSEGLPTVLLESSLCSLFAIASNVTGVKDIIQQDINGVLYNPDEIDGLEKVIIKLLEERPLFKSFDESEKFSVETFENNLLSLLNS